jgi:hypothetical protein
MGVAKQLDDIDRAFAVIARFPELKDRPVVIGESDPEGCAACRGPQNGYRNGTMYSSYTAASFARKHNLADKHDTHVAVCLRLIEACQRLPPEERPRKVIGCEVWRDLDWLCDEDKLAMAVDGHEALQAELLAVFESQIASGKRYDLAGLGRRRAHATFFESHALDQHSGLVFGMDLTPLLSGGDAASHAVGFVARLEAEIRARIARLSGG